MEIGVLVLSVPHVTRSGAVQRGAYPVPSDVSNGAFAGSEGPCPEPQVRAPRSQMRGSVSPEDVVEMSEALRKVFVTAEALEKTTISIADLEEARTLCCTQRAHRKCAKRASAQAHKRASARTLRRAH